MFLPPEEHIFRRIIRDFEDLATSFPLSKRIILALATLAYSLRNVQLVCTLLDAVAAKCLSDTFNVTGNLLACIHYA